MVRLRTVRWASFIAVAIVTFYGVSSPEPGRVSPAQTFPSAQSGPEPQVPTNQQSKETPNAQTTLQLPKAFDGCWQGTVQEPDTWRHVRGPRLAGFIPVTYKLCFQRMGQNPIQITFSNSTLDTEPAAKRGYYIRDVNQRSSLVSATPNAAWLLFVVSYPETGRFLWLFPGFTGTISRTTALYCTIESESDSLEVEASSVARCDGASSVGCSGGIWTTQTWHARFSRWSNDHGVVTPQRAHNN